MNSLDQIQRALYDKERRLLEIERRISNLPSRWSRGGGGGAIRYGMVSSTYADPVLGTNQISLTPCDYLGTPIPGASDVAIDLLTDQELGVGPYNIGAILSWRSYESPRGAAEGILIGHSRRAGDVFSVDVVVDGGDAGDQSTPCSYTYTATCTLPAGDVVMGTGLIPQSGRPSIGTMTAANTGMGCVDVGEDGATFFLKWVNEVIGGGLCETP